MLNRIIIMGRLTRDPELRYTPQQVPVCTISVAVDRAFAKAGEQRESDFFDVVCWRQTAEFVSKYFTKGRMIAVDGRLQTRKWKDKFDQNRVNVEIVADNVSFCGDKAADRQGYDYGTPASDSRYAEPRYTAAPAYGNTGDQTASAGSKLPPVSDFSELADETDDVPF